MIEYLQQFLYEKLTRNTQLNEIKGVYFQSISGASFPYIYIGDFVAKNISSASIYINEIHFNISLYSREKSQKIMFSIIDKIKEQITINIEDKIILLHLKDEKIINQNDGITQQYIMKFKCIIADERN
jgi:hypothetical protein